MVTDIRHDTKIKLWFANEGMAQSTRNSYSTYMQLFCDCIGKSPSEIVSEANIETRKGLLLNERNAVEYFAKFKECLAKVDYAPKSQGLAFSVVRSFYKFNDIQLSSVVGKNRKRLPLKDNQVFLTWEEVKKLVDNAKPLRNRAVILLMVSSGMARREILNLKVKDIVFDESGIGVISVRRQKTQIDYTTFCSPEAVEAIRLYYAERDRTLGLKIESDEAPIFVTYKDGYRFKKGEAMSERLFTEIFREMGEELGFKNGIGWIKSRSHALRKFFSSTLLNAGISKDRIDFMLGHVSSDVDRAYFQHEIPKLKDLYIQNVHRLSFKIIPQLHTVSSEDTKKLDQLVDEKQAQDLKILELNQSLLEKDRQMEAMAKQLKLYEQEQPFIDFLKNKFEDQYQFYRSKPVKPKYTDDEQAQEAMVKEFVAMGRIKAEDFRPSQRKKNIDKSVI